MERTFCLLIGLSTLVCGSDQFWFSYKTVTANGVSIYEEKNITPVMTPLESKTEVLCRIELHYKGTKPKALFLKEHFDTLLPCFYVLSSHVLSWDETQNQHHRDRVELLIAPTRFTVVFKDEFATINTFR